MTHEPKVGELPALTDAQKAKLVAIRLEWSTRDLSMRDALARAMQEGIAAEREARKDEARDSERLDWLLMATCCDELADEHPQFAGIPFGISKADYLLDMRARIDTAIAALQAEQPESP